MGTVASAVALGTMDPGRVSGLWRSRAELCVPSLARPVVGTSPSDGLFLPVRSLIQTQIPALSQELELQKLIDASLKVRRY